MEKYIEEFESYYKTFRDNCSDISYPYDYINDKIDLIIGKLERDLEVYKFDYKNNSLETGSDFHTNVFKSMIKCYYYIDVMNQLKDYIKIENSCDSMRINENITDYLEVVKKSPIKQHRKIT